MKKKILGLTLCAALLSGMCTSVCAAAEDYGDGEVHTIGVAMYDPDSAEMEMFGDYYRDYIEKGFPVKFIFSGKITDTQSECDFIEEAKENGAEGIISFAGFADGLQDIIKTCEQEEIYYALGSNSVSDENYEAIKDNPWYMGSVGPELEAVYEAGCDMTNFFLDKGAGNIVIMSGGAASGNRLHQVRTWGMLNTLEEKAGLVLSESAEELSKTNELTELSDEDGTIRVTICPGYTEGGDGLKNLEAALSSGNCDTLMSAFHVSSYLDKISAKEKEQNSNIMVGAIDSFSEQNFEIFKEKDAFGNAPIDFVRGKYASMAGPAFAMIYNAITGASDAVKENGAAVRLYQNLWTAKSEEEYIELYGYATGIYENAYSCDDLIQVIRQFNEDADPQSFKELTEASDLESAKERIFN
nr:hypothetical protein [uncultured Blautia sp.]